MATSGVLDFSKTPAQNIDIGGIATTVGAMAPSAVGPAFRALAAILKKWQEDIGGASATTGSADAYLLDVSSNPYSAGATYADGDTFSFIASFTNAGPATLNVESEGAKAIRKLNDQALAAGDIVIGSAYTVHYDSSANGGAGAFLTDNAIGNFQPLDASLTAYAALTTAANKFLTFSAADTPVASDISANGVSFMAAADYAAMRTLLGLVIGTNVQAFDSDLTAWAGKTAPDGTAVGHTDTQTLTNKTIDADDNTIADLETDNFKVNVVDTDTALASDSDTRLATQRATKAYVDASAAGINWAAGGAVACATTANITLSGEQTLDGVLTSTSRVLVKAQTAPTGNGIYVSAAGAWARATDADTGAEFVRLGVFVSAGTTQAGTTYVCTRTTAPTLGVDNIAFVQNGASAVYTAGTGLGLTGNQFNLTDAELLALLGLTSAADRLPYFTGSGTAALATFTDVARTLVAQATQALMRTTGLGLSANGSSLVSAADYAAMRTLLTLGTAALKNTGTSGDVVPVLNGASVTFANDVVVPDEAYNATAWNGSLEVPTKNAARDKIETLAPLASPALTGTPTAPTPTLGDTSTQIATMEAVSAAVNAGTIVETQAETLSYAAYNPSVTRSTVINGVGAGPAGIDLYNHVPAIAEFDGGIDVMWLGNPASASESVTGQIIYHKRSTDDGATWSAATSPFSDAALSTNPITPTNTQSGISLVEIAVGERAFYEQRGTATEEALIMATRASAATDWTNWRFRVNTTTNAIALSSTDIDGAPDSGFSLNYSLQGVAYQLTIGGAKPFLDGTRLILPCVFIENAGGFGSTHYASCLFSDDDGSTWAVGGIVPHGDLGAGDAWEPCIVKDPNGIYVMHIRDLSGAENQFQAWSESADLMSWSPARWSDFNIHTLRLRVIPISSKRYLFLGPAHNTNRNALSVGFSGDGRCFPIGKRFSNEVDGTDFAHYSDVDVEAATGDLLIVWSRGTVASAGVHRIEFVRLSIGAALNDDVLYLAGNDKSAVENNDTAQVSSFSAGNLLVTSRAGGMIETRGDAGLITVKWNVSAVPTTNPYQLIVIGNAVRRMAIQLADDAGPDRLYARTYVNDLLVDNVLIATPISALIAQEIQVGFDKREQKVFCYGVEFQVGPMIGAYAGYGYNESAGAIAGNLTLNTAGSRQAIVPTIHSERGSVPLVSDGTQWTSPGVKVLNAVTANTTISIPPGWAIDSILYANTTANVVTGGVRIGKTAGAADVVVAQGVGANALAEIANASVLLKVFSRTVAQTLFIQAVTAWNSASVEFSFVLKKVY